MPGVQGARLDAFLDRKYQRPLRVLCILSHKSESMGPRDRSADLRKEDSWFVVQSHSST